MKTKAEFKKFVTETIGSSNIQLLKRTYQVLLLFCFCYINVNGQTNFAWAKSIGGSQVEYFYKIAVDPNGNSYVTGLIYNEGSLQENQFVAKYNSSGIQQWISASFSFEGRDICVDGSGNSYITGYNNEGGAGHILLVKLSPTGGILWFKKIGNMSEDSQGRGVSVDVLGNVYISADNGLIAKYNTSGVLQWMQKINSSSINAIDVDAFGNVIVAGHFSANVTFGSINLNAPAGDNIFIAKVSPAGAWLWAIRANEYGHPMGLDVDGSNNIFITGQNGTHQLGHIFLSKYNASGVFQWSQTAEARDQFIIGSDVSVDNFNNVYITGSFGNGMGNNLYIGNTSSLNPDEYSTTLTKGGSVDIYFAKYGTDGSYKWAQNAGGTGADFGYGIANDPNGNIYLSGSFTGSIVIGNITLTGAGNDDGFIAKLLADNIIVNNQKVAICHRGKTINVSQNAVAAHLAHGDKLGICTTSKILTVYMDSSLVVDETSLALYPNPSSGLISYEICKNNVREEAKIEIKNSIGQIVYSKTPFKIDGCIKETIELNSDLPEGVYILNLIIGEIVENRKLILTK